MEKKIEKAKYPVQLPKTIEQYKKIEERLEELDKLIYSTNSLRADGSKYLSIPIQLRPILVATLPVRPL